MSETVLHGFISTIPDDVNSRLIRPSAWNAEHKFSGGSHGYFLMRDTTSTDGVSFQNLWARFATVDMSKPPYNVDMTGAVDASAIINNAINTLGNGARLSFPPGIVKVGSPIEFDQKLGITLLGSALSTQFRWSGGVNIPMFHFWGCQECELNSLSIYIDTPLHSAVSCDTKVGVISRSNRFTNITINGTGPGLSFGFITTTAGGGGNLANDYMTYTGCVVISYSVAGWAFLHSNSRGNTLYACSFFGNGIGAAGILASDFNGAMSSGPGGSFTAFGLRGGGNYGADFFIYPPVECAVIGGDFKSSKRLLLCDETVSPTFLQASPTLLQNIRWEDDNVNVDGYAIYFRSVGPLTLINNTIGVANLGHNIQVYTYNPQTTFYGPGGSYTSIGNRYQVLTGSPFAGDTFNISLGDIYLGSNIRNKIHNLDIWPLILTANLPAASLAMSGRVYIEDAGAGNRNLIIYGQNERFRIDGGAAF